MKNVFIILSIIFILNPANAFSCICEYITNEFHLKYYDDASIVAIVEILAEDPRFNYDYNGLDSVDIEIIERLKLMGEDYPINVIETFKGNTGNLKYLHRESFTSCSGQKLMVGQKYLFFLFSNNAFPETITYNLCTQKELIAESIDTYVEYYNNRLTKNGFDKDFIKRSFFVDSVTQQDKLSIMRQLRDVQTDSLVFFFTGFYIKDDKVFKRDSLINFRGQFKSGKRTGFWEIYSPISEMDSIWKKANKTYHLLERGSYKNGEKIGQWQIYYFSEHRNRWILKEEEFE